MSEGMVFLAVVAMAVLVLAVFDLLAMRYGADSRDRSNQVRIGFPR